MAYAVANKREVGNWSKGKLRRKEKKRVVMAEWLKKRGGDH